MSHQAINPRSRAPFTVFGVPVDRDDFEQEQQLAMLEASRVGLDPELAAKRAGESFVAKSIKIARKEMPVSNFSGLYGMPEGWSLDWIEEARKVRGLPMPPLQTHGQTKKFLRNQVIMAAVVAGFSQRQLATVFDLPHSRIAAIVTEMKAKIADTPREDTDA